MSSGGRLHLASKRTFEIYSWKREKASTCANKIVLQHGLPIKQGRGFLAWNTERLAISKVGLLAAS